MGMVVQHNMNALNAYNKLNANVSGLKKSSEKLASGYRINRAGDDAAGLAISEKMRSQIKGLNQAVRNSQDGINMIQTYEGAAQESHNILRRMKELASEAANGTYQNEVDRDAAQLEFNQLNDELNQIADTDFNGVAMLNGGVMADGTKAVNGKFDYAHGNRGADLLGKRDVNTLDDSKWNTGDVAKDAWLALNATWKREDGKPDTYGPESVDVTFEFDATANTWTAREATNGADVSKVTTEVDDVGSQFGGFTVMINEVEVGELVIDTANLKTGDKITLTFNNPSTGVIATAKGAATLVDGKDIFNESADKNGIKVKDADDVTIEIGATAEDVSLITKDIDALIDKLNNAQLKVNYTGNATEAADLTLRFSDTESYNGSEAAQTMTVGNTQFHLTFTDKGVINIGTKAGGKDIAVITAVAQKAPAVEGNGSTGMLTFDLGFEKNNFEPGKLPSIEVKSTGKVSVANSYKSATAPLTYTDHLILQTGARTKDSVDFTMEYATEGMGDLKANLNISSRADGLNTANLSLATQKDANYAIDRIDNAINKVSMVRATFGATQNRLEHKIDNLTTTSTNIQEAESNIRDTDMASEMMNYTKFNILQQAAQSMLAQANQQPQSILQLLG